jgi:hypothetical protein
LGKFKPKPVWLCEGEYKNEDKEKSKKEVVRILKLCKKEHVLINSPAIANLIYVNRLNKREAMEKKLSFKGNVWEETSPMESPTKVEEIKERSSDEPATVPVACS